MATFPTGPGPYRFRDGIAADAPFLPVDIVQDGEELMARFNDGEGDVELIRVADMDGEWKGPSGA